jgi:hypothetical protein
MMYDNFEFDINSHNAGVRHHYWMRGFRRNWGVAGMVTGHPLSIATPCKCF